MNAYEKRKRHRQLLRRAQRLRATPCKAWEVVNRIDRFEQAQLELNGYIIKVKYNGGWYWIGPHAYRASQVDEMSSRLEAHAHVRDNPPPEEDDES